MRTKTIDFLLDHLIWFIIYSLPLLAYLLTLITGSSWVVGNVNFTTFMSSNFNFTNTFYTNVIQVFGTSGILELVPSASYGLVMYLTYLFSMTMLHLVFDIFIYIPRVCINWCETLAHKGDM